MFSFSTLFTDFYDFAVLAATFWKSFVNHRAFVSKTALSAETMSDWKETNFEADLAKLEKEAEERLDTKITELQGNIETIGTK